MKRTAEEALSAWYHRSGRKPLIMRGARQVGKSTLVRQAAARLGVVLWEINLERNADLETVFARYDTKQILQEIGFVLGQPDVGTGQGILFLDEIQATPSAIAALRYFHEDRPDIAVVAAGSLLEIALANARLSMPVGRVEYHYLGPMTFLEFLEARGDAQVVAYLRSFRFEGSFSYVVHAKCLSHLRDYLMAGGMPEALAVLCGGGTWARISAVQRGILDTFADDFGKYASGATLARLQKVFARAPALIGRKLKYAAIDQHVRTPDLRQALELLARAGIVSEVVHSDATGLPLGANCDPSVLKLLFLDIGLVNSACGIGDLSLESMRTTRFVNEGAMAEQFIGQHLLYGTEPWERPSLYYWIREGKSGNAEIDYCIVVDGRIVPVEVKAGTTGTLRSLHQFACARGSAVALRFDANPPTRHRVSHTIVTTDGSRQVSYELISLPLYMVEMARALVGVHE